MHLLRLHLLLLCLTPFLTGCNAMLSDVHSLDFSKAVRNDQILSRRYVLTEDAAFPVAKFHFLFVNEDWNKLGQLYLTKGTILQLQHVEELSTITEVATPETHAVQAQAIVQIGPHKGSRVSIGSVEISGYYDSKRGEYIDKYAVLKLDKPMAPLPDHPPAWLNLSTLPPQVSPVPSETLRKSLADPDWIIRYYALNELIRRDPSSPQTIRMCGDALHDQVSDIRTVAAATLKP